MKRFTAALLFIALSFSSHAQLESGTISPNFVVTDQNGYTWNLYNLLADGKMVVMDVFATWCAPCWEYHQSGVLKDLWEQYGGGGTNEIFIISIEIDPGTTHANLYGIGGDDDTKGNWVEGTPYPVAENEQVGTDFSITYIPTIYIVCPDRIITEVGQNTTVSQFKEYYDNCGRVRGFRNASLLDYTYETVSTCGEMVIEPTARIQNLGILNISSLTFEIAASGEVLKEFTWTGQIPSFDIEEVSLGEVQVNWKTNLEIDITKVNYLEDDHPGDNLHVQELIPNVALSDTVILEILTDRFGNELYWQITNEENDELVATGGNQSVGPDGGGQNSGYSNGEGHYEDDTLITEIIVLPEVGCYKLLMTDRRGDGICCRYGLGYFRLLDLEGQVLLQDGDFGDDIALYFSNDKTLLRKVPIIEEGTWTVFPNPASNDLYLEFGLEQTTPIKLSIYNTMGQLVQLVENKDFDKGNHRQEIDVTRLSNGLYYLQIEQKGQQIIRRFVVSK